MAKAKMFVGAGPLLVLASCAVFSITAVPDTSFAPGAPVQAAVAAYYKGHAMEHDGRPCYRPYFDAITKVDVIKEDLDHLVLELRYAFHDRIRDNEDTNRIPPSTRRVCWGFKSRQFTLSKDNGGIQVTEMTGPIRGASSAKSQVILGAMPVSAAAQDSPSEIEAPPLTDEQRTLLNTLKPPGWKGH